MQALGVRCRFSPSCSAYAQDALRLLPLGGALLVTCWRLLRCGPWTAGGHDPVGRNAVFFRGMPSPPSSGTHRP